MLSSPPSSPYTSNIVPLTLTKSRGVDDVSVFVLGSILHEERYMLLFEHSWETYHAERKIGHVDNAFKPGRTPILGI